MPFDGKDGKESRRSILANVLRHSIPDGHHWYFGTYYENTLCGTIGCAIGVAHLLWPEACLVTTAGGADDDLIAEWFGMTDKQVERVFYLNGGAYRGHHFDTVTPAMVANILDKIDR